MFRNGRFLIRREVQCPLIENLAGLSVQYGGRQITVRRELQSGAAFAALDRSRSRAFVKGDAAKGSGDCPGFGQFCSGRNWAGPVDIDHAGIGLHGMLKRHQGIRSDRLIHVRGHQVPAGNVLYQLDSEGIAARRNSPGTGERY